MQPKLIERLPLLELGSLEPGDVFLSRGCDDVAVWIARLDGSLYSHAAIWTGERVVEAVSDGITHKLLEESLEEHRRGFVHVYRPKRSAQMKEKIAESAIGLAKDDPTYAWGDLLLVSLVAWFINPRAVEPARKEAWKLRTAAILREVREFLDRTMPEIRGILSSLDFDQVGCMTCSQLIATSFAHAAQLSGDRPLRLTISGDRLVRGEGRVRGAPSTDEVSSLRDEIERLTAPLREIQIRQKGREHADPFRDSVVVAAFGPEGYPPHLVTPRDIFSSPDLVPVGRFDLAALGYKHCAHITGNGDPNGDGYIDL